MPNSSRIASNPIVSLSKYVRRKSVCDIVTTNPPNVAYFLKKKSDKPEEYRIEQLTRWSNYLWRRPTDARETEH